MQLKSLLIIFTFLMVGNFIFQLGLRDTFAYQLYGFDLSIMNNGSFEAFRAAEVTFGIRRVMFSVGVICNLICLILAVAAIVRGILNRFYINRILFGIALLFILLNMVAAAIPGRSL